MVITLGKRTAETVAIYFERANTKTIKEMLPQKAQTLQEALEDYEATLLPDSTSFGMTIYADSLYVGDIWCYCIDLNEEPNCMLSFCIFEPELQSKGIATTATRLFIDVIKERFNIKSIGAFTFSNNFGSIRVLEKNGFSFVEEFEEDGVLSKYFQIEF